MEVSWSFHRSISSMIKTVEKMQKIKRVLKNQGTIFFILTFIYSSAYPWFPDLIIMYRSLQSTTESKFMTAYTEFGGMSLEWSCGNDSPSSNTASPSIVVKSYTRFECGKISVLLSIRYIRFSCKPHIVVKDKYLNFI